jgi:hypothetical protein
VTAQEFRARSTHAELIQWKGGNAQEIYDWLAAAGAYDHLSTSLAEEVLVLHVPGHQPGHGDHRAAVGDWVGRIRRGDGGSDWFTQPAAEFDVAWELVEGPVQQLRNIASHDIGGNNPNLADVLNEFADLLEQDMSAPPKPLPPAMVLVRADDLDSVLKGREFPPLAIQAVYRLSAAAREASRP